MDKHNFGAETLTPLARLALPPEGQYRSPHFAGDRFFENNLAAPEAYSKKELRDPRQKLSVHTPARVLLTHLLRDANVPLEEQTAAYLDSVLADVGSASDLPTSSQALPQSLYRLHSESLYYFLDEHYNMLYAPLWERTDRLGCFVVVSAQYDLARLQSPEPEEDLPQPA